MTRVSGIKKGNLSNFEQLQEIRNTTLTYDINTRTTRPRVGGEKYGLLIENDWEICCGLTGLMPPVAIGSKEITEATVEDTVIMPILTPLEQYNTKLMAEREQMFNTLEENGSYTTETMSVKWGD